MKYTKYDNNSHWDDFDILKYLYGSPEEENSGRFYKESPHPSHGTIEHFVLDRYDAHMLLSALEFDMDKRKMLEIDHLCKIIDEHSYLTPPDQPVTIDVRNRKILDGVKRIFLLKKQRTPRVVWIKLVNKDDEV